MIRVNTLLKVCVFGRKYAERYLREGRECKGGICVAPDNYINKVACLEAGWVCQARTSCWSLC
nr:hypothetical protein Q903MT_gene3209 [Picea sitchensis]